MDTAHVFARNRVILSHFDSYSCALNFARSGDTILTPPLAASASDAAAVEQPGEEYAPAAVLKAVVEHYGLNADQLKIDKGFEAWLAGESAPIRVHLVRISSPDIPHAAIEPLGAVFKPISQMRGMPQVELNLMRKVFDLTLGG